MFVKTALRNGTLGYIGVQIGVTIVNYIQKGNLSYLARGWKVLFAGYLVYLLMVAGYYGIKYLTDSRRKK